MGVLTDQMRDDIERLTDERDEARAEVERLRRELRFYALKSNHRGVGRSVVYEDGGRRARLALGPCPTCTTHNGYGCGTVKTGRKIMDQDGPYDETKTCPTCRGEGLDPSPSSTHQHD